MSVPIGKFLVEPCVVDVAGEAAATSSGPREAMTKA
jgi:hypothetical protein